MSFTPVGPPNYELLKDAYAIIGGIPESAINLDNIQTNLGESLGCNTICCALGWLGHHPQFRALGLETTYDGKATLHKNRDWYDVIAAKVFNLTTRQADEIFGPLRQKHNVGHKRVWLNRVKRFLKSNGQLKSQLKVAAK